MFCNNNLLFWNNSYKLRWFLDGFFWFCHISILVFFFYRNNNFEALNKAFIWRSVAKHYTLFTKLVQSRWLDIDQVLFAFLFTQTKSSSIKGQKGTRKCSAINIKFHRLLASHSDAHIWVRLLLSQRDQINWFIIFLFVLISIS